MSKATGLKARGRLGYFPQKKASYNSHPTQPTKQFIPSVELSHNLVCQACSGSHSKDKTCKGVRQLSDVTGARSKDKTCKGVRQFSDVTGARSKDKTCKGVRQFSDVTGAHSKDKACKGVRQFSDVTGARSKDKACVGSGVKCHWVLFEGQDLCG